MCLHSCVVLGPLAVKTDGSDVNDQTLDDVLPAAQAGQARALRVLYDAFAARVHGYLRSRGAEDPEDLTSEVFLAVFPRLVTVTGGAVGLRTLLSSVAHAGLVEDLRRQARRGPTVPFLPERARWTTPSAEDEALHRQGGERVRGAGEQVVAPPSR